MITLLLKTKMELFEWLQQQLYNGEEIERERETRAPVELRRRILIKAAGIYIRSLSIQSSPGLIVNRLHFRLLRACEHVHLIYLY